MTILISGAAGNLGSFLARHLLRGPHALRLLVHRRPLAADIAAASNVSVYQADLDDPRTLAAPCRGADCIVHVAGVLFAPRPERFLPRTNVGYVRNLVAAALDAGVTKFILISFPHVEGESTPQRPATGRPDGAGIGARPYTPGGREASLRGMPGNADGAHRPALGHPLWSRGVDDRSRAMAAAAPPARGLDASDLVPYALAPIS